MNKIITLLLSLMTVIAAQSQTTEYTTGQTYTDAWTGWSTPVTTGTTGSSINGANMYIFTGTNGVAHTIEIYRQFTINSNDLDLYLAATTQNATVSIQHSTDNVTYTEIGSQVWGAGFSQSTLIVPTFNPITTTFYLKLKIVGTFGGSGQSVFNNLKIDAVLNSGSASVGEFEMGSTVFYANKMLNVNTGIINYNVEIFDLNGRLIGSHPNMKSFDFTNYEGGLYFVAFTYNGERKTLKIAHIN